MKNPFFLNMQRIGVEAIIFLVYAIFSISWAATGSLMPEISKDLGLNQEKATLITSMIVIAKIFGASFAGALIYRFGLKKGYFLGCILISSGIFFYFVEDYKLILLIRFATGLGSACALVCLVPITQQWFKGKALDIMISFNLNSNIIGIALGVIFAESVSNYFGNWRLSLSFYAWLNLFLLIIWLFIAKDEQSYKDPKKEQKEQNRMEFKNALKSRLTWGMIVFYIGPILFLNMLFTFLPTFYAEYAKFDSNTAQMAKKIIPAIVNLSMILGPCVGLFFKRKGIYFKVMLFCSGLCLFTSGVCMLFLKDIFYIEIFAVLSGVFLSLYFPFFFNLPSELKDSTTTKTAYIMSVFWSVTFIILAFNLWLFSFIIDKTHSFSLCFIYVFALILISTILSQFILPQKDKFKISTQYKE